MNISEVVMKGCSHSNMHRHVVQKQCAHNYMFLIYSLCHGAASDVRVA